MESSNNYASSIRDKRNCKTSCTTSKRRDIHQPSNCDLDRMISGGGWILWNAIAVCVMTKTSWQTGNLKMNEDSVNPSRTCSVRGRSLEEDILIAEIEELEKSDTRKNPRRLNAIGVLITQKRWRIYFSLWQMVQQNFQEEATNSKNAL